MSVLVNVSTILDEWYNECTHGSLSLGIGESLTTAEIVKLEVKTQYMQLSTGLLCLLPLFTTFFH